MLMFPSTGVDAIRRNVPVLAICCVLAGAARAQEGTASPTPVAARAVLPDRGRPSCRGCSSTRFGRERLGPRMLAQADSAAGAEGVSPPAPQPLKSPGRCAAAIPPCCPEWGEFYAGARKRAVLFLGLEAARPGASTSAGTAKGKEIEEDFRGVADEQWDVLRYVDWRGSTISRNSSITHALPCSTFVVGGEGISGCPRRSRSSSTTS